MTPRYFMTIAFAGRFVINQQERAGHDEILEEIKIEIRAVE